MTAAHLKRVLDRLHNVRPSGQGWSALCPAHDDRRPSLAVGMGTRNPAAVLLACHAGCDLNSILSAIGITVADLYPDRTTRGAIVLRSHPYVDESGEILYRVKRLQLSGGRLSWSMDHPTEDGWVKGRGDACRVLYRLTDLARNPDLPVWLVEGERDADTLAARGMVATTVASGTWTDVDTSRLHGRRVRIVVDNDLGGWKRGRKAMAAVQLAGGLIDGVFRPADPYKDATTHFAEGIAGDLIAVDLDVEIPPCEKWTAVEPRPKWRERSDDGRPFYSKVPTGLVLDRELRDLDVRVWALLDDKAGLSGIAKVVVADLQQVLGRKDKAAIGDSIRRLEEHGYVKRLSRGNIGIHNPARRPSDDVHPAASSHDPPTTTPAKDDKHRPSATTSTHPQQRNSDDEHRHSAMMFTHLQQRSSDDDYRRSAAHTSNMIRVLQRELGATEITDGKLAK